MIFNLWNPATTNADRIRFDVTRANMPRVGRGDDPWVRACLSALGISTSARTWSIQAARCQFYSDYAEEPEWRDRWPETWIVNVQLAGPTPSEFDAPDGLPIQIDEYDRSWNYGEVDPDHDRVALLLSLWHGSESEAATLSNPLVEFLRPQVDDLTATIERAGANWTWLRFIAKGGAFPERLELLEDFASRCKRHGLIVNHNSVQ